MIGTGDIATCEGEGDVATGDLIRARPHATVFTTGDNAYRDGTPQQFLGVDGGIPDAGGEPCHGRPAAANG